MDPSLWTEPSPPSLAVQALLPAQNSDGTAVAFREVDLDTPEVSLQLPTTSLQCWQSHGTFTKKRVRDVDLDTPEVSLHLTS